MKKFDLKIKGKRKNTIIHIAIIVVGIVFTLLSNFYEAMWFDESYSVAISAHSFGEIWSIGGHDVHPVLYYWILHILRLIFGNNIIVFKLFSAICISILGIIGFTHIRKDFGSKVGILFSFFAFFLPLNIIYAGQIRMYPLAMLLVTLTVIYAYRIYKNKENKNIKNWILFGVFSLASAYTHYYALAAAVMINLVMLVFLIKNALANKKFTHNLKAFIIVGIIQILAYIPWLIYLLLQAKQVSAGYWIEIKFPGTFIEMFTFQFTGNLENDYESLIKSFFYSEYILKYKELKDYLKKYPNDRRIQEEMKEIEDQTNKILAGNLSVYDYNKIQKKEKAYFQELRKIIKVDLTQMLANNIFLKIDFLRQIGALNNYENEYNHTLEKLSMPSSFRINDKKTFEQELLDKDKLKNYSISELVALNAFWTNRLVKEVERRNEVIYVLQNSNNFMDFSEGKEFELIDEDIMYYLAEYRAIVPYITKFKNDKRNSGKAKSVDKNSNLATVVFDIKEIFEQEDIDYYGFNDLDAMAYNVLLLNNRSQLLYDQKDIAIQEMISFIVNTNEYRNAGISFESDEKENTNKPLIVIDLKGFNAPLMLHMIKGSLTKNVKNVSGKDAFPVYRGGKDIIINSTQEGKYSAKTNVLFKLNSQQRKDISARAGLVGPRDTNARYVTHISWMLNPKKDMPELIREPKKVISLETGEITVVEDEQVRKR